MRERRNLLAAALATLALFAAHHVYGALRYDTPWRHHAAAVAAVVAAALGAAELIARSRPRAGGWAMIAVAAVVPVLLVGAFEGLYNHVLKDVLFLGGAPREVLVALFPPPRYELPDDLAFELSGVLQVVPAALAALAALRLGNVLRRGVA